MSSRRTTWDLAKQAGPYQAYAYSYPHKTAYRNFVPRRMSDVWENEDQSALFLYAHIPFCEMRCGFCNLFTLASAKDTLQEAYCDAFERQAALIREELPDARFARIAIGGGTPSILEIPQLERVFASLSAFVNPLDVPVAIEVSPATISRRKLDYLKTAGVNRISVGIQSFIESETKSLRRPQSAELAHQALELMRTTGFDIMNVDLIYGIENQTPETFKHSLHEALKYAPEEIYLYPLYVRPLTGLGRTDAEWDDFRQTLYRVGRDLLFEHGYVQLSMRMFRRSDAVAPEGPPYACQADGMVGLGVGARSYTSSLHFSTEFAVGRPSVKGIIQDFVERPDHAHIHANYGFELNLDDQKRRHIILSLLSDETLLDATYASRFGSEPESDFPELQELVDEGISERTQDGMRLTSLGLEWSDAIGPWLTSPKVKSLSEEFELR